MKKLLGILVLGLLWCNVVSSKPLEIANNITIRIPENYEYVQFEYKKNLKSQINILDKKDQKILKKIYRLDSKILGLNGKEIVTKIAKKGFSENYSSWINHTAKNKKEEWIGNEEFRQQCPSASFSEIKDVEKYVKDLKKKIKKMKPEERKKALDKADQLMDDLKKKSPMTSEEYAMCFLKAMKIDPLIYIFKSNKKLEKEQQEYYDFINNNFISYINLTDGNMNDEHQKFLNDVTEGASVFMGTNLQFGKAATFELLSVLTDNRERIVFKGSYTQTAPEIGIFKAKNIEYRIVVDNSFVTMGVECSAEKNCIEGEKILKKIITRVFGSSDWGKRPRGIFQFIPE